MILKACLLGLKAFSTVAPLTFGVGVLFVVGGCPVPCRMFRSILGHYMPIVPSATQPAQPEMSPDIAMCLLGAKSPSIENH